MTATTGIVTSYSWSASDQIGTTTGSSNCIGCGAVITNTLTNTTPGSSDASIKRYTVTPSAYGCDGDDFDVDITINKSNVAPMSKQASIPVVCITTPATTLTQTGGSLGTGAIWEWHRNASYTALEDTSTAANAMLVVTRTVTTTYYLRAVNATSPCNATTTSTGGVTVTVTNSPPAMPAAISGPIVVCGQSTVTYSVTAVAGVTYNWTLRPGMTLQTTNPAGNIITVSVNQGQGPTMNGNISVNATNACGTGLSRTLNINLTPATPNSSVAGPTSLCGLTTASYSCAVIASATSYNWTLPAGLQITSSNVTGNMITATRTVAPNVSITGNVTITTQNACGFGTPKSLAVNSAPVGTLTTIGGPANLCALLNTPVTYTVNQLPGATYAWVIPAGITYGSGQGSNTIVVTPTNAMAASATLKVSANNGCASTAQVSKGLYKIPNTGTGAIAGNANICGSENETYTFPTTAGATSYNWIIPSGAVYVSGQGTTSLTINVSALPSGLLKVSPTNSCGTGAQKSMALSNCLAPIFLHNEEVGTSGITANIYPNPTLGNFTVEVSSETTRELVIEVYDVLGNLVMNKQQRVSEGETKLNLSIEDNQSGIYFVRITDKENKEIYKGNLIKE